MEDIFIGTSGYYYSHWKGVFYPEEMSSKDFLKYYLKYFNTLELNSTFYHVPKESTFTNWYRVLPSGFLLSMKANKLITHIRRLNNVQHETSSFFEVISALREKLGVVLFQLPPSLKCDLNLLRSFLSNIDTKRFKIAIEFRHKSWLSKEVFDVLKAKNVSLCISSGYNIPYSEEVTTRFAYFRFHGKEVLYGSDYSESDLSYYKKKILDLKEHGIASFAYFNNDFEGFAVRNALLLKEMLKI